MSAAKKAGRRTAGKKTTGKRVQTSPADGPRHSRERPSDSQALARREYGDVTVGVGVGGETHQVAGDGVATLTTQQGMAVSDDQNTLTAGSRGPQLLEDFVMREKIFHFDHERIPERVVHARGYGARGYFELTDDLSQYSRAAIFGDVGAKTDVFARFSTVAGNKGSADLARDARGFAVKFYTREGNWDLVGNNIPVFFIQDAMKFPDLVHSVKAEPDRGFPQAQSAHDNFWDFISLMPEAAHMIMWTMSDRGIPRGFRFMEGFGVHTFRLVDTDGHSTYVKFHWKPKAGLQSVVWDEALKINGADPDFHRRDLWNAIESGDYPEWELGVQLFDDDFADRFDFDVLDATKLIPEEDIPVRVIGRMVLNRNVDNFFAETEQVAFCTQNIVPGIDFTNDPLLQGRNFSYLDTQLKRLGSPNFTHLPVNAPRCPMANFYQDGHMAMHNPIGRANYEPNSWAGKQGGPRENPAAGFRSRVHEQGGETRRVRAESFADHYSQARQFYRSQTDTERDHIGSAIVFELSKVETVAIRTRMVALLQNIDGTLARTVADGLGMRELPPKLESAVQPRDDLAESDALSILKNGPDTFAGRKLGVLVSDGCDAKALSALRRAFKKEGATVELVAATVQGVSDSEGRALEIGQKIDGGPSVLYDAVAILVTEQGAQVLAGMPPARQFIIDAWAHKKYIGRTGAAAALFDVAGALNDAAEDAGVFTLAGGRKAADRFVERCRTLRQWDRG